MQRYEPSMFRYRPQDDITRYVSEWIQRHITELNNSPHIEIEAKLGVLIDKRTQQRLHIHQIETEAVISDDHMRSARFKSDMTFVMRYTHRYELDKFYRSHRPGSEKVRVTIDTKTNDTIAVIEKKRIADLNIYSPSTQLDYRISINLELPADHPYSDEDSTHERNKDRLSYVFQCVQVDLTQVTDGVNGQKNHELECEIANMDVLLREKDKLDNRQQNQFQEIVGVLLNNVRALAKESNKFTR
ncbi:mRNA triphosphatase CET1, partial [Rhizoclosmatium globosum]